MIEVKNSIHDAIDFGSEIERQFALDLDSRPDIKLFIKLPAWFKVETPIGTYNPDWAIVKQPEEGQPGASVSGPRNKERSDARSSCAIAEYLQDPLRYRHFEELPGVDFARRPCERLTW